MFSDPKRKQTTPFHDAVRLIQPHEVVEGQGWEKTFIPVSILNTLEPVPLGDSGVCGEGEELIHSQMFSDEGLPSIGEDNSEQNREGLCPHGANSLVRD